ncbi:MAG: hypothetical protein L3J63_09260, partial [Geopsychrobacter sp.]|nr:hypothetical protein [Geopsychrobacter sp.]
MYELKEQLTKFASLQTPYPWPLAIAGVLTIASFRLIWWRNLSGLYLNINAEGLLLQRSTGTSCLLHSPESTSVLHISGKICFLFMQKEWCMLRLSRMLVIVVTVLVSSSVVMASSDKHERRKSHDFEVEDAGQIQGHVDYCKSSEAAGLQVYIPGQSYLVIVSADGKFMMHQVVPGTYNIAIARDGNILKVINGISVRKKQITSLGSLALCPDQDGDNFNVATDCNDLNARVYPGAPEGCNGIDDNCDGQVDEGCPTCSDADADRFFAQAYCGSFVDCND